MEVKDVLKENSREIKELLTQLNAEFELNPLAWGMYYCKTHIRDRTPVFHYEMMVETVSNRFIAIASPRESAKSTLIAFLRPAHAIFYRKKRFIVICSNTFKKAAQTLETIKAEIKENAKIVRDSSIKIRKDAEGDSIFSHSNGFETRVLCKGAEQLGSIRGEKFKAYRPDLIIVDDLEDDELVRSAQRRRELKDVFDEALIPAGDKKTCDFNIIGTILHDDSLIAKLVDKEFYPEYKKMFYQALVTKNGEETSLWPEKWSVQDLKKIRAEKPTVFAKEYQNDPVSGGLSVFSRENFRYWAIENNDYVLFDDAGRVTARGALEDCQAAVSCDLAWEEKRQNDYTVIMPGFLTPASDTLVEYYTFRKGMRPHEMEETLFSLETRLRALTGSYVPIGFEKAMLEKVIKYLLRQAMSVRNHYLSFVNLRWEGDKTKRIITPLEPRYNQRSVYHRRGMGDLEHQLLRLPSGTHDDLPDALQGLIQLLKYPKRKKKVRDPDNMFMRVRQYAIDAGNPKKGVKTRVSEGIPAIISPV